MNTQDSLRPITRRAIPLLYISPLVCRLPVPFSASVVPGVSSLIDFFPVRRLAGPESLTVTASGNSALLQWSEVSYAVSYAIYRRGPGEALFSLEASNVLVTHYTDEDLNPGTYEYKVTALEPDFGETFPSPVVGVLIV